jgi:hypothetical protein
VPVDVFLRAVPSDADPDDARLYDPTVPDGGGTNFPVNLTFAGTGTLQLQRNVGVNRAFTGTGSLGLQRGVALGRPLTGTGALALTKNVGLVRAFVGNGQLVLTRAIGKALASSGTGSVALTKNVGLNRSFTGTGTPALVKAIAKFLAFSGTGTVTLGTVVTPGGGTNTPVSLAFSGIGTLTLSMVVTAGAPQRLADPRSRFGVRSNVAHLRRRHGEVSAETKTDLTMPEAEPLAVAIAELEAHLAELRALLDASALDLQAAELALAIALEQRRRLVQNLAAIQWILFEYF